eukprot:CAMPEP_0184311880 /NCGR_PEP_ID=MMETSP1049-20130417/46124_1 /TAXON_ID=77928 /ORGANISM="Proteomonas sulcata, Strain CCMP704" /LENGTH=201 /DNA_ID=CAMNT_0026627627 /DNA_START=616 /DNA_END=1223 /DNA_ORIENTATION=-
MPAACMASFGLIQQPSLALPWQVDGPYKGDASKQQRPRNHAETIARCCAHNRSLPKAPLCLLKTTKDRRGINHRNENTGWGRALCAHPVLLALKIGDITSLGLQVPGSPFSASVPKQQPRRDRRTAVILHQARIASSLQTLQAASPSHKPQATDLVDIPSNHHPAPAWPRAHQGQARVPPTSPAAQCPITIHKNSAKGETG